MHRKLSAGRGVLFGRVRLPRPLHVERAVQLVHAPAKVKPLSDVEQLLGHRC
jgi:hypothetical protein